MSTNTVRKNIELFFIFVCNMVLHLNISKHLLYYFGMYERSVKCSDIYYCLSMGYPSHVKSCYSVESCYIIAPMIYLYTSIAYVCNIMLHFSSVVFLRDLSRATTY